MAVDLSRVGLEGIDSFYRNEVAQQSIAASKMQAAAQQFELQQEQKTQALGDQASKLLNDIALGKGSSGKTSQGEIESNAEPLEMVGDIFMRGGAPEKGMDYLKGAMDIRKGEADLKNAEMVQRQNKLENIIKVGGIVGSTASTVKNQSEWEFTVDTWGEQELLEPDQIQALREMPWESAAFFAEQGISAKDKATMDMAQANQERLQFNADRSADNSRRLADLAEARDAETVRRNIVMEKAGGKGSIVAPPNSEAFKSAKATLLAGVFKDADIDTNERDLNALTHYIANQVEQMVRDNKAISRNTATQRAIIMAEQSGVFETYNLSRNFGAFSTDKGQRIDFKPMPKSRKALKIGDKRMTSQGPGVWTGEGFEVDDGN